MIATLSLTDRFNQAMQLWFELTGFDPDATKFTFASYDIRTMNEEIMEAFKLDDSLITSYFLLAAYSDAYFQQRTVSIDEMDKDPDRVISYMRKVKEFRALISAPELVAIGVEFQQTIARAMAHYNVPLSHIQKVLDDRHELAFLRRDALRSMEGLRINQFLAGEPDPADVRPLYNPTVFSYWNMNSCIEHLCGMPSGVSLNLIRDPDELHSYFCFTIRNGGNLVVLSDVPEYAHPLGRQMSRRPDRAYDRRVSKNWFPYQLLQIAYDEEGNAYHDKYRETQARGLVPHQPEHFRLKEISELEPQQIIWTALVFDLIVERHWRKRPEPLPLSYTAEMIRIEDRDRMLGAAARSNLPVVGYQPLSLPPLTAADVRTEKLGAQDIGRSAATRDDPNFGSNAWAEKRYGDRVIDEVLNLVAAPGTQVRFITRRPDSIQPNGFGHGSSLVPAGSEIQAMDARDLESWEFFRPDRFSKGREVYQLEAVDATTFGTAAQIDADRKFLARYNFAVAIQREADREYEARKEEVRQWFREKVAANIDQLLCYAIPDTFNRPSVSQGFTTSGKRVLYRFARVWPVRPSQKEYDQGITGPYPTATAEFPRVPERRDEFKPTCFIRGDCKAFWHLLITPRTVEDLVLLTGVPIEQMPDVVQHWRDRNSEPYTGNSILNRIDPLEWAFTTPWEKEAFSVRVYLSKRGRKHIARTHQPPAVDPEPGDPSVPYVIGGD